MNQLKRILTAACAALTLTACGQLQTDAQNTVTITYNDGGLIAGFQSTFARLDAQNARIEIVGHCSSACTIFLGARNVCVGDHAVLGFHGAFPKVPNRAAQFANDMQMGRYMPPAIRARFVNEWRFTGPLSLTKVSGPEIRALVPSIPRC